MTKQARNKLPETAFSMYVEECGGRKRGVRGEVRLLAREPSRRRNVAVHPEASSVHPRGEAFRRCQIPETRTCAVVSARSHLSIARARGLSDNSEGACRWNDAVALCRLEARYARARLRSPTAARFQAARSHTTSPIVFDIVAFSLGTQLTAQRWRLGRSRSVDRAANNKLIWGHSPPPPPCFSACLRGTWREIWPLVGVDS